MKVALFTRAPHRSAWSCAIPPISMESRIAGAHALQRLFPRNDIRMVGYGTVREVEGIDPAARCVKGLVDRFGASTILEVGAGANPTLTPDYVKERGFSYT